MENKEFIEQMTDEINSLELQLDNFVDDLNSQNLSEWTGTTDEKLDKEILKMEYRRNEIKEMVTETTTKFDLTHTKTYNQLKEIVILKLFEKEIQKRVMAEIKLEKGMKNSKTDFFAEQRKYSELISKLIKQVYISPVKKNIEMPSRDIVFGSNKYILID